MVCLEDVELSLHFAEGSSHSEDGSMVDTKMVAAFSASHSLAGSIIAVIGTGISLRLSS